LKRKDAVRTSQTFSGPELIHHISANSPLPNANTCGTQVEVNVFRKKVYVAENLSILMQQATQQLYS
jgi:hypothetical protein